MSKEEQKSPIEMLLDENNTENLKMYDEDNNLVEFEQIAIIPIADKIYAILKPVEKREDLDDDQAIVVAVDTIDDEDCLVEVYDEEIIDKVFDEYYELLKEEGIKVDEE